MNSHSVNRMMQRHSLTSFGPAILFCLLVTGCGSAEESKIQGKLSDHDAFLEQLPTRFYEPGMGDLMHSLQLRHAKLWYAGKAANWELAAFEMHEIEETLERTARWHAEEEEVAVGPAIKVHMGAGIRALEQSLAKQDPADFEVGYDRFTSGCNSCHAALKHGFITIKRPTTEPVPNQEWDGVNADAGL
jgi:hypothetical protein